MSTITEEQYRQLKLDVEEAKAASQRARGALERTVADLKDQFGANNLKEAKEKLAALKVDAAASQNAFEKAFKTYDKKWNRDDDGD